jgi:prophage regulatory protein
MPIVNDVGASLAAAERLISLASVAELVSVSKGTIYYWVTAGKFPAPLQIGPRRIAFREADVAAWLATRQTAAWRPDPRARAQGPEVMA